MARTGNVWLYHINPKSPQAYDYGWDVDRPRTLLTSKDRTWGAANMRNKVAIDDVICVYLKGMKTQPDGVYVVGRLTSVSPGKGTFRWRVDGALSTRLVTSPIPKDVVREFFGRGYGSPMQRLPMEKAANWIKVLDGTTGKPRRHKNTVASKVHEVLRTHSLEIVDRGGEPRAWLCVNDNGITQLVISDEKRDPRAVLAVAKDGDIRFSMLDSAGKPRSMQALDPDGTMWLGLYDQSGKGGVGVSVGDGAARVSLSDPGGTERIAIVLIDGVPSIELRDPRGKTKAGLSLPDEVIDPNKSAAIGRTEAPRSGGSRSGLGADVNLPNGRRFSIPRGISLREKMRGGAKDGRRIGSGAGYVDVGLHLTGGAKRQSFVLPAGLVLIAANTGVQNGLIVQEVRIEIAARAEGRFLLEAYCANKSRQPADSSTEYTFGPVLSDPALRDLFALVAGREISIEAAKIVQDAVWEITDGDGLSPPTRSTLDEVLQEN